MQARRILARLTLAIALLAAFPAYAAGPSTPASAQEAFVEGQKRFDAKDYAGALDLFRQSLDASGSPNARLYVARCLKQMGKLAEAYEEMSRTAREATARAQNEAKYVPTRDAAAAELALLEPKVGKLVVALADAPTGTEVTMAGSALAKDRIGTPVAVEPGHVHVEATAPGEKPLERDVEVNAGETKTVALSFTKAPAPSEAPAPAKPEAPVETTTGGGVRVAGYVVTGLGASGIAVFAIIGAMSNSKYSSLEKACGGVRCTDPSYADEVASGKRLDLIANVALIAGGVTLATGIVLIAVGGPKRAPTAALSAHPGGASFRARF